MDNPQGSEQLRKTHHLDMDYPAKKESFCLFKILKITEFKLLTGPIIVACQ